MKRHIFFSTQIVYISNDTCHRVHEVLKMKTLPSINISFFLDKNKNEYKTENHDHFKSFQLKSVKLSDKGRAIKAFYLLLKHTERFDLDNNRTYFSDII